MFLKTVLALGIVFGALHFSTAQFGGMKIDCKQRTVPHLVSDSGCTSKQINVNICEGTCRSLSEILMKRPWYNTYCQCCKQTGLDYIPVELGCGNTKRIFNIPSVKGCSCKACSSF